MLFAALQALCTASLKDGLRVGPGDGEAPRAPGDLSLGSTDRRLGVVRSGAGGDAVEDCDRGVLGGTGGIVPGVELTIRPRCILRFSSYLGKR